MQINKIIFSVFFLLVSLCALGQKQNNNWFFGNGAGLTWQTQTSYSATGMFGTPNATLRGMPTNVTDSPMNTFEGCFTISDIDGNLLFFSDGITIWNKNKLVMEGGASLTGNPSSAQSGIILPYPRSRTKYVAVSLGEKEANNLSYSIVDMSKNGGLGAVDLTQKNILFTGQSGYLGESVAAVRHSNKYDFWIVAPGRTTANSYLNVWKVTDSGVQTARHSVVTVGRPTTPTQPGGYVNFSPDGKHIVWIDFGNQFFCYADFDTSTGIISNLKVRSGGLGDPVYQWGYGYGAIFSPNGKYLYLTYVPGTTNDTSRTGLVVFDFDALKAATNPNLIAPIRTLTNPYALQNGNNDGFGTIQKGSDNRLYISAFFTKNIFVIDNPNDPLNMKIYKISNILSGLSFWGLPNFAAPWFMMTIDAVQLSACAEIPMSYQLLVEDGVGFEDVAKITVDFGDNTDQVVYDPVLLGTNTMRHTYKAPGTYNVVGTAYNKDGSVNVTATYTAEVNSCILRVNPNIRGVNK